MLRNKISSLLSKYRKWIYSVLFLPTALLVIFQLIDSFIYPLPYLSLSKVHLAVLFFAELLILYACFDIYNHSRAKQKTSLAWQLVLGVVVLNLIAVYGLTAFYEPRSIYPLVSLLLSLVPALKAILILSALFCFWMGFGSLIVNFWDSFSFTGDSVEQPEKKWITGVVLAACFIIGLGLRLYNLAGFPPYVDEYIHIHAAGNLMAGEPLTWDRAYLTVTLPVYLSYRIFGMNLWGSRLPMVLINMLAIFPLYFLGRKVNRWVGYISVLLYVISPWIIAVSRTVRDYAVVPVFFYLAALLLIDLLDWEGLSFKQYLFRNKYRIVVAMLILAYALFDKESILKIIVVAYGIFGALALLKILKNSQSRRLKIAVIGLGVVCFLFMLAYSGFFFRLFKTGILLYQVDLTSWNSLVNNSLRQWYPFSAISFVIILIGVFFAIRAIFARYRKSDFVIALCYLAFTATLVYLVYFLVNPYIPSRVRYGILMEYWYLLVVAVVLYVVLYAVQHLLGKRFLAILAVIVTILFVNYQAINVIFTYQGGGIFKITGEHHYVVGPSYEYLVDYMTDKDILMTDVISNYDLIAGQQLLDVKKIRFLSDDPLNVINEYPQGWIAVTAAFHPQKTDLQFSDFDYVGKHIHYYGLVGEVYMWQWGSVNPH